MSIMIKNIFGGIRFSQNKNIVQSSTVDLDKTKKLKIAVIIDTALSIPPTTGVTYRLVYLTKSIQSLGHEVVWIIGNRNFANESDLDELKKTGCTTHLLTTQSFYDIDFVSDLLVKDKIDVVQYEITQTFLEIGIKIREKTGIPTLLEFHDTEATLKDSLGSDDVPLMQFLQYSAGIEADSVVVMTPLDRETIVNSIGVPSQKVFLAPNGIESKYFNKREIDSVNKDKLLFLGNLFYEPNQRALIDFADNILPRLVIKNSNIVLRVIGMLPDSLREKYSGNKNIELLGEIKDEEYFKKLIQECAAGLCTVKSGSGMKVKILNYAAAGLPVITTKIGESGYENLESLIKVENEDDIIIACENIINNPENAFVVGEKTCKEVLDNFGWKGIAKKVEEALYLAYSYNMDNMKGEKYKPFWLEENRHSSNVFDRNYTINEKKYE
jgi:glycosyltransferase involved in cell wall biosynthesis